MKFRWRAIGTEFGGRQALHDDNHAGNHEAIRIRAMPSIKGSGVCERMLARTGQCMAGHDEDGWPANDRPGPRCARIGQPCVTRGAPR